MVKQPLSCQVEQFASYLSQFPDCHLCEYVQWWGTKVQMERLLAVHESVTMTVLTSPQTCLLLL